MAIVALPHPSGQAINLMVVKEVFDNMLGDKSPSPLKASYSSFRQAMGFLAMDMRCHVAIASHTPHLIPHPPVNPSSHHLPPSCRDHLRKYMFNSTSTPVLSMLKGMGIIPQQAPSASLARRWQEGCAPHHMGQGS
jgi:hypothetical protein